MFLRNSLSSTLGTCWRVIIFYNSPGSRLRDMISESYVTRHSCVIQIITLLNAKAFLVIPSNAYDYR